MPSHQPLRNMSMPCPHKLYVQNGSWRDQSWFLISLIISIKRTYSGEEVFLQLEHFNELWNEVQDRLDKILYIWFIYTAFKIDYSNSIFPSKMGKNIIQNSENNQFNYIGLRITFSILGRKFMDMFWITNKLFHYNLYHSSLSDCKVFCTCEDKFNAGVENKKR